MTFIVEQLRPDDRASWDHFVAKHPKATIYHTSWWHEIIQSCFGHKSYSFVARSTNGLICGILPLFHIKGFIQGRLVTSPLRDRGGLLGTSEACSALAKAAKRLSEDLNCGYVVVKQGEMHPALDDNNYIRLDHWITMVLDLPVAWKQLNSKIRWGVRKAERAGLRFEIKDGDPLAADRFFEIFKETRRRLGVPTYARHFFRLLARQSSNVYFCFAAKGGVDLAGIVLLRCGNKVLSGYAANTGSGRVVRASDFVHWHAIHWASESGYETFDFGADSPTQTGLRQFKEKWGALEEMIPHFYYLNNVNHIPVIDSTKGYWRWLRKPWTWMPEPWFETLSDWVIRFAD